MAKLEQTLEQNTDLLPSWRPPSLPQLSASACAAFVLAVAYSSASVSKTSYLGIYAGEWFAFVSLCLLAMKGPSYVGKRLFKAWFFLPFALWTLVFLAIPDLVSIFREGTGLARFPRHAVLFIYPVLWPFLGYCFRDSVQERHWRALVWALLAVSIASGLLGKNPFNLALGPAYAFLLPVAWIIPRHLQELANKRWKIRLAQASLSLAFLLPIVTGSVVAQRTTLALNILNFVYGIGLALRVRNKNWRTTIATMALSALVLFSIFWVRGTMKMLDTDFDFISDQLQFRKAEIKNSLFHSWDESSWAAKIAVPFQHADDFGYSDGQAVFFQSRFRKDLWTQSWKDWLANPIRGVGFRVEVPSHVYSGTVANQVYPHDYDHGFFQWLPISGPHNSYLNLLVRTGAIGFLLWCVALFFWLQPLGHVLQRPRNPIDALGLTLLLNTFLYAFINLGLEGPHYAIPLYFLLGALYRQALCYGIRHKA